MSWPPSCTTSAPMLPCAHHEDENEMVLLIYSQMSVRVLATDGCVSLPLEPRRSLAFVGCICRSGHPAHTQCDCIGVAQPPTNTRVIRLSETRFRVFARHPTTTAVDESSSGTSSVVIILDLEFWHSQVCTSTD